MKITDELKQLKTDRTTLFQFGMSGGIFFSLLDLIGFLFFHKPLINIRLLSLSFLFFGLGFFLPNTLKWVYLAGMAFALAVNRIISPLILSLLYFLGITPIAIIGRLFGKQFLERSFNPAQDTFWITKPPKDPQKSCETQG